MTEFETMATDWDVSDHIDPTGWGWTWRHVGTDYVTECDGQPREIFEVLSIGGYPVMRGICGTCGQAREVCPPATG